jgi:hypothetical protein
MKLLRRLVWPCALVAAIAVTVGAGPRKVQVMPVDGNAEPALRGKLDKVVQKLAHSVNGKVLHGTTSFADAAMAVGCDPSTPACVDTVMTTLGADELVWGTATTENGQTTLVVKRATKGVPPTEQTTTLGAGDPPDKAEEGLKPLFGGVTTVPSVGSGSSAVPPSEGSAAGTPLPPEPPKPWSSEKKLGIGFVAGGAAALVVGFALWAKESNLQTTIDASNPRSYADIVALKSTEDTANTYAWVGNALVIVGAAAGGIGAYYLWKDHKNGSTTIAPVPADQGTGMTLVVKGHW